MHCTSRLPRLNFGQSVLDELDIPENFPEGNPQRAIYCSRTLNLRSIKAIGEERGKQPFRTIPEGPLCCCLILTHHPQPLSESAGSAKKMILEGSLR